VEKERQYFWHPFMIVAWQLLQPGRQCIRELVIIQHPKLLIQPEQLLGDLELIRSAIVVMT
jgi:hypothetical protein